MAKHVEEGKPVEFPVGSSEYKVSADGKSATVVAASGITFADDAAAEEWARLVIGSQESNKAFADAHDISDEAPSTMTKKDSK